MQEIFSKSNFPKAPGGNIYHWKETDTEFEIKEHGKYVIAITASAKNADQNSSNDDDDLRIALDGYEFGIMEVHEEKIPWKGFGTASSFDGSSLKGGDQTTYIFTELWDGNHQLKFFADCTPTLKEITIWKLEKSEIFDKIKDFSPFEIINTNNKGIPFLSFIFLGVKPKKFEIAATCKVATKEVPDGDNIKVVNNGKIIKNRIAPDSKKYQNFIFEKDDDITNQIKKDNLAYERIIDLIKKELHSKNNGIIILDTSPEPGR